jgi:ATP-dependent helicase/DNAse subunit B
VVRAFRERVGRDPLLVVPTQGDADRYGRELAEDGAVLGGRVLTFRGLFHEIAGRAGHRAAVAGAVQRQALVAAAVARTRFVALGEAAGAPGFVVAAERLLRELHRERIDPARMARAAAVWAGATEAGEEARERVSDVARLMRSYLGLLEGLGWEDEELRAGRALDALRAAPWRWGTTPVLVYGFDDLTSLQRDAVETIAAVEGADVVLALTFEPGRVAFASRAGLFNDLAPGAAHEALEDRAEHYAPASREPLHHLERRLFEEGPHERVDPAEAVALLEGGGERAEAELVAAEVLRALEAGVPAEEIGVLLRSPRRTGPLLSRVLAAYGVPHALERRVALGHTPPGRALVALLRCATDPAATPEDLLAYLRAPGRLDRPELADQLEAELRTGPPAGLGEALEAWERIAWPLDAVGRVRDAARRGPVALLDELDREASRLLARPHLGRAALLDGAERDDARAMAAGRAALGQLRWLAVADASLAPDPVTLARLLERHDVRLGDAPGEGRVEVTSPLRTRARRYRVVVVAGLQEGAWPRRGEPDPFLPDELRDELRRHTDVRLRDHEDQGDAERYLLYAAVSRAEDRVAISFRDADEAGSLAVPSPFLTDVRALFAERLWDERRRRPLGDVTWPEEEAPTPRERLRARALAAPVGPEPGPAPVRTAAGLAALDAGEPLSAGALEAFLSCPVKWLVDRLLDPEPLEPDPEFLARGQVAHDVLAGVLEALRSATGSARVTAATLPEARRLLAEAIGRARLPGDAARATAALRRLQAQLERWLDHEAACGGTLEPELLEWTFGFAENDEEGGGVPPLELGDGAVRLRGRVDRVETGPAGAVVRDYKTGRFDAARSGAGWAASGDLQVALYLLAVRRLLGLNPLGALYQPLKGDLRARGLVTDAAVAGACHDDDVVVVERLTEALEEAEATAVRVAAELRAGRITPRPSSCSRRGCLHPDVCRGAVA